MLSACLYSSVLTLDFPSEYFTSTVRVFTPAPLRNRLFELCIAALGCVGLRAANPIYFPPICLHLSLAPDRAPTILSVTPHTTTSVLVRWQVR